MLFRAMRVMKRGIERVGGATLQVLAPVGRILVKLLILPIYRVGVMARLRIQRLALPARSLALFFVTNRFLFHATLGAVTVLTIISNLQGRQAHAQDVGQKSVLFALATDPKSEIIEEVIRPEATSKNANYLGNGTVISLPHVDFDYDEDSTDVTPSIIVPGTIAALPLDQTSGGPKAPRTQTETYIVQDNDTIGVIAQRFGVNVGTILWNNNLTERQYIRPGDTLKIPPVSGMLATVKKGDTLNKLASTYGADVDEIASFNNLSPNQQLNVGAEIVVPGGRPAQIIQTQAQVIAYAQEPPPRQRINAPSRPIAAATPSTSESSPDENLNEGTPSTNPPPKPPDADTTSVAKNHLFWPTSSRTITQYYGWNHTGIDIDGDYSSPLYAAADGIIEKAGWNSGGYGLMILINHPNDIKTRYGHASKLFVKAGDTVTKGQVIAMMGTTGRSTGTHLHFEVYRNDKRTNPLAYIR